jgi:hypothetical protein
MSHITPFGAYYYMTMSFLLKNTGSTYQRAIQACFKEQLNKNVEAYVDDMVVKTRNSDTLITDLEEIFASLREYQWKLNPNKRLRRTLRETTWLHRQPSRHRSKS